MGRKEFDRSDRLTVDGGNGVFVVFGTLLILVACLVQRDLVPVQHDVALLVPLRLLVLKKRGQVRVSQGRRRNG